MADEYDFQIDDLKFRAAISDDFPYQRATAPFRKEQFDSAPTVGDQSLTGWWTRGQLSFHKGAGLKYYEVLEGETVLNRFQSSDGVSVRTPGVVTLNHELTDITSTVPTRVGDVKTIRWAKNGWSSASGVYYIDSPGLYYIKAPFDPTAAATAVPTVRASAAGWGNCLTGDGSRLWLITDNFYIEALSTPSGSTEVYNHSKQVAALGYAKGRLWVLANDAELFAEAPSLTGPSVALSNSVGRFDTGTGVFKFQVADAPSGVYITVGTNRVYYITVGNDGAIPTLTAPTVAAELPDGELIESMAYYLGSLVVTTSRGFRAAAVQSDGGLIFGPILKDMDDETSSVSIAADGTSAYFIGQRDRGSVSSSLYEVDLAQPATGGSPGQFAWCRALNYSSGTTYSDKGGVVATADGLIVWGQKKIRLMDVDGKPPTYGGSLTTGYHRFGTLDPKSFQTVSVRVGGAGGRVQVYRVDADGTTTYLGAVYASDGSGTFPIGLSAPTERIALKFHLYPDSVDASLAPELLGYQIKALPVPERQRLLKWPLTLTDQVRSRYGKALGHKGKGWDDVQALEALESSAAVVTFTDHRTGETGSAYIDSVEFVSNTPSLHNDNGFGGIAYLTLRVID